MPSGTGADSDAVAERQVAVDPVQVGGRLADADRLAGEPVEVGDPRLGRRRHLRGREVVRLREVEVVSRSSVIVIEPTQMSHCPSQLPACTRSKVGVSELDFDAKPCADLVGDVDVEALELPLVVQERLRRDSSGRSRRWIVPSSQIVASRSSPTYDSHGRQQRLARPPAPPPLLAAGLLDALVAALARGQDEHRDRKDREASVLVHEASPQCSSAALRGGKLCSRSARCSTSPHCSGKEVGTASVHSAHDLDRADDAAQPRLDDPEALLPRPRRARAREGSDLRQHLAAGGADR